MIAPHTPSLAVVPQGAGQPVPAPASISANPIEEYKALQAQIAELQSRAAVLHQEGRIAAIAQVKVLVADFQIGLAELDCWPGLQSTPVKPRPSRSKGAARYYDPASGNSWSGNGRVPAWLKGKDRNLYLVSPQP